MIKIQTEIKKEKEKEVSDLGPNLDKFEKKYYNWLTIITTIIVGGVYIVLVYIPIVVNLWRGSITKSFALYLLLMILSLFGGIFWLLYYDIGAPFYEYFIKKNLLAYQEDLKLAIKYHEKEKNVYEEKYLKLIENKDKEE